MFATCGGQPVVLGAAVEFGDAPLAVYGALFFEAVEGLVERGVIDVERLAGAFGEPRGDGVAVHRLPRERLEDEDVERSVEQVVRGGGGGHIRSTTWPSGWLQPSANLLT